MCKQVELLKLMDDLKVDSGNRVRIFSNSNDMKQRSKTRDSVRRRNGREMQKYCSSKKIGKLIKMNLIKLINNHYFINIKLI